MNIYSFSLSLSLSLSLYIYIYIYIYVYIKIFESMVTLCYKDKVKGSTLRVHGAWERDKIFFYRGKGRVMHIAMHVKSTKRLPTHNVIYSIVQWYLKERHDLSEVPFWSIGDRKTVSS